MSSRWRQSPTGRRACSAGGFEPSVEPARWARALASWLCRCDPADRRSWEATAQRARVARSRQDDAPVWSDEWLDHLYGFEVLSRGVPAVPSSPLEWNSL